MGARAWLVGLAALGSIGATATDQPSPARLTTIVVRGHARDIVLVDPRGRINRSGVLEKGEVSIPECLRWDGGTETTLYDDSVAVDEDGEGDVVTDLELSVPIVGRYRLYAETTDDSTARVDVTPVPATPANHACPDLTREVQKKKGRFVWNIDFLADTARTTCPVRLSGPYRSSTKK